MSKKVKQILAITAVALLVALYIVTLILAICGNENTTGLFMACIFATVAVPVMLYVYIWLYQLIKKQMQQRTEREYIVPDDEAEDGGGENK